MKGAKTNVFVNVHCRTGSLESSNHIKTLYCSVHCRTGSLERTVEPFFLLRCVHCRTGSLEKPEGGVGKLVTVHCRTGSLEMGNCIDIMAGFRSLPYRQLRNWKHSKWHRVTSSLPYRQLSDRGGYGRRVRAVKAEEGSGVRIKEMKRPGIIPAFSIWRVKRENDQRLRKTMRPLLRSYGVSSTVTLSPVRMRM